MEEELQQNNELQVDPSLIGPTNTVNPEVIENKFAAPFQSKIGFSSVDLTNKEANDKMLEEYDTWWKHGLNWGVVAEDKKMNVIS